VSVVAALANRAHRTALLGFRSNTLGRRGFRILNAAGFACLVLVPCRLFAQDVRANTQLLSFRSVHDTVMATRSESTVEATVAFVVHNQSGKMIYRMTDCGQSPMYWVEREELDSTGKASWRDVFSPGCTWVTPLRPLDPSDSALIVSRLIQFPGQWPEFSFSNHSDVVRLVYVVSTVGEGANDRLRVISPPVVIKAP
jgi:hypothetical protein